MDVTEPKVNRDAGAAQSETVLGCVTGVPVLRHTRALKLVLGLTLAIMVAEVIGGWLANSLALLADAGHMLTDSAAVALALFASWIATRPATAEKTFGYLRLEILAALINGTVLIVLAGLIVWQAIGRLMIAPDIEPRIMFGVAALGLVGNAVALRILHAGHMQSLNVRGAYLHVLGDLLGSVGAVTAGAVILLTGWTLADPLISLFIAILILIGAVRLVRESVDVLLEATPPHIDLSEVAAAIAAVPGVTQVHDLHVWTVTSGVVAMSGHAVVCAPEQNQKVLEAVQDRMEQLGIHHVTLQVENVEGGCG
ncbi:MAG: cation transporter [Gemmatimonadota bacterium]|nr:MAG: cation transporter [Gemmatimonadota bacterium]